MNTRYLIRSCPAVILIIQGAADTASTNALVLFHPAGFDGNSSLLLVEPALGCRQACR